jgi:hypothetical protein
MKKFIAVIAAVASVVASTSIANAGGTNAPGGSTAAANFTSVFNGSVAGTCSLTVMDGTLPTNQGFVSSLTTVAGGEGKIKTVCNTTTSTLNVTLDPGVAPVQAGYVEEFALTAGTGAYALGGTATVVGPAPATFAAGDRDYTDLSNAFSATESVLDVTAKGSVAPANLLAAGNYTINVKATVTP